MVPLTKAMKLLLVNAILLSAIGMISSCSTGNKKLPVLGERYFNGTDTVYHRIAPFSFINQDSALVTNATFDDKIYVADFFFTTCRTICPRMKKQMSRVYDATAGQSDVLILSHSIDPEYDTVGLLHDYAERMGVSSDRWHFVTGVKDSIFKTAQTSYFVTAAEDSAEPDGFIHSGAFLLVDKDRRIRGKYNGVDPVDVDRLIADIAILRKEYEK
jgi:protein SCO1